MIDRAAILGNGESLEVAKALGITTHRPSQPAPASATPTLYEVIPDDPSFQSQPDVATLDAAMKEHIEGALDATRGRIEGRGGAAQVLGINPHTLRARMRKLGIDWSRFRRDEVG